MAETQETPPNQVFFTQDEAPEAFEPTEVSSFSWTASEFIAHEKTGSWYVVIVVGAAILSVLAYLITKDLIVSFVFIVASLFLAFYGSRKPRELEYELGPRALRIADKVYPYADFHSFSIIYDGAFPMIYLTPMKRLGMSLTVYYSPDEEAQILDILKNYLPYEAKTADPVDSLMRKIRF